MTTTEHKTKFKKASISILTRTQDGLILQKEVPGWTFANGTFAVHKSLCESCAVITHVGSMLSITGSIPACIMGTTLKRAKEVASKMEQCLGPDFSRFEPADCLKNQMLVKELREFFQSLY
jgi:hypothetical protein